MYTVSIYYKLKEYIRHFAHAEEAKTYAQTFWHLSPIVRDPSGCILQEAPSCCSAY